MALQLDGGGHQNHDERDRTNAGGRNRSLRYLKSRREKMTTAATSRTAM